MSRCEEGRKEVEKRIDGREFVGLVRSQTTSNYFRLFHQVCGVQLIEFFLCSYIRFINIYWRDCLVLDELFCIHVLRIKRPVNLSRINDGRNFGKNWK